MGEEVLTDENGKVYVLKEYKPFYKKPLLWALVAAVVVVAVIAIGISFGSGVGLSNQLQYKEVPQVEIGEEVKVGDIVFKASKTSTANNIDGTYSVPQGTYLIVDVEVRNEGSKAWTLDSNFFKLFSEGKEFEVEYVPSIYANEPSGFPVVSINPDMSEKGKIVFDVSDTVLKSDDQVLQVQVDYGNDEDDKDIETGKISLK